MFDAKVMTSYVHGTVINMDACDTLNFMTGLAITVINDVARVHEETNQFDRVVYYSSDEDIMGMISTYVQGVPEAIHSSILQTNGSILLSFVQDIVLNESTRGLYLFYNKRRNTGYAPYDLVVKALDDLHQHWMKYGNEEYKRYSNNYVNRYNAQFLKLIKGE